MHHYVSWTRVNFFLLPDNDGNVGVNLFLKYVYLTKAEFNALIERGS